MNGAGNQNAGIPTPQVPEHRANSYAVPTSGPIGNNMYQQTYYPQQNMAYGQQVDLPETVFRESRKAWLTSFRLTANPKEITG